MVREKFGKMTLSPKDASWYLPDAGSSSGSDTTDGNDLRSRRNALNKFLSVSGVEAVHEAKKIFTELQQRTKMRHVLTASESIVAVLNVVAPEDAGALWEATKESKLVEKKLGVSEDVEATESRYLRALAETYIHATGWDTRRQTLSIMADLAPYSKIQKYLPCITHYRVKVARHHKQLFGRGAPVIKQVSPRMRVEPVQLDHFLTFVTSPHVVQDLPFGQRHLQLSNGKVVEAPNVIREMVKERTIKQYHQYCEESNFKPFSYATMHRILTHCTASVRKSLQGLDYISADGSTAFDDLSMTTEKLTDSNFDHCKGQKLQQSLKEGKQ